jgi:hypothetical protein
VESNIIVRHQVGSQTFEFDFCRKTEDFDGVMINHWWLPVTQLYGQRLYKNSSGGNHGAITDSYWALCREAETTHEARAQECFLLAKLVPHVRNQGSRKIFPDSFPGGISPKRRRLYSQDLEALLASGQHGVMTFDELHHKTSVLLLRSHYPRGAWEAYSQIIEPLLACGKDLLNQGCVEAAIDDVRERWSHLMTSIGRRAGRTEEKAALDAISYEARAAFHDCYSEVWCVLLRAIHAEYGMTGHEFNFLRLWHFAHFDQTRVARGECGLWFHGHIFALHPGMSWFLTTRTGRQLMGNWLRQPTSNERLGQLLNGLYIALYHYSDRRASGKDDRRKSPKLIGSDIGSVPATQTDFETYSCEGDFIDRHLKQYLEGFLCHQNEGNEEDNPYFASDPPEDLAWIGDRYWWSLGFRDCLCLRISNIAN